MKAAILVLACAACRGGAIRPSAPEALPAHREVVLDGSPKARPRLVPPEAYLRAYLAWFGGLAPLDVQARARGKQLFEAWGDYLTALGLPDYRIDLPRQTQSNALMLAALGRLAEALCVRAAERDLHRTTPVAERVIYAFEPAQFDAGFDVLHRTFLGYPASLAPGDRAPRFRALFDDVRARHPAKNPLSPDETAWAAVCTALVQHPEAGLY